MSKITIMKYFISLITALFFLSSCAIIGDYFKSDKLQSSGEFVLGSEDIPLAKGMKRIFEESLGFDSHSGSILSLSYKIKADDSDVKDFYLDTLPQLGWKNLPSKNHQLSFKRENEKLEMDFISKGEYVIIEFLYSSSLR